MHRALKLIDTYDTLTDTYILENLTVSETAKELLFSKNTIESAHRNNRLVKGRYQIEEVSNIEYERTDNLKEVWDLVRLKLNPKARRCQQDDGKKT